MGRSSWRSAIAREHIVDVAWDEVGRDWATHVAPPVSRRELARHAGVSASVVARTAPDAEALAVGMARWLVEHTHREQAAALTERLARVGEDDLAQLVRSAAREQWQLATREGDRRTLARLSRLTAAAVHPDAGSLRAVLAAHRADAVADVARSIEDALGAAGLAMVEPFTVDELVRCIFAVEEAFVIHSGVDPHAIRTDLFADAVVALAATMTTTAESRRDLDDLAAALPQHLDLEADQEREAVALAVAAGDAGLFADGVERVTFGAVAGVTARSVDDLSRRFGSVRHVAAVSFARHLDGLREAAARFAHLPERSVIDLLCELARRAQAEPDVARALLVHRVESRVAADPEFDRLVPLDGILEPALVALWVDGADRDAGVVAAILVDSTLAFAAADPTAGAVDVAGRVWALV